MSSSTSRHRTASMTSPPRSAARSATATPVRRSPCCAPGRCSTPTATVGAVGIVSGDELIVGPPYPVQRVPPIPAQAVTVDALAGPDAGSSYILLPGTSRLGRDDDADVRSTDPTVSRRHARVTVDADWTVTVTPLAEAENGVTRQRRPIAEPTVIGARPTSSPSAGPGLSFRRFVRAEGERLDQLGQIEFQRTPYRPPVVSERTATRARTDPRAGRPARLPGARRARPARPPGSRCSRSRSRCSSSR